MRSWTKCVAAIEAEDEAGADGLPQCRVDGLLGRRREPEPASRSRRRFQAGEQSQGFLRRRRQPAQLRGHQIRDVVGEALGADASHVPPPGRRVRVEREQLLLGQRQ